jgi:pepF/M3 family oligoendopeptidase
MIKLETDRLSIRRFKPDDLNDFFEYAKLDTVGPMAGWLPHPNIAHSQKILASFITSDEVFAIELKQSHKLIGSIGLHKVSVDNIYQGYELGYVLSPTYQHQGYMQEAVTRIIDYGFLELKIKELAISHFIKNYPSEKLIKKFPFKFQREINYETRDYGNNISKFYIMKDNDYINMRRNKMKVWNLDKLYLGFDDPNYQKDLAKVDELIAKINKQESLLTNYEQKQEKLLNYLKQEIEFSVLVRKLLHFASLTQSVESTNPLASKNTAILRRKLTELTKIQTIFTKWIANYPEINQDIASNDFLKEHEFYLKEIQEEAKHLLTDDLELIIAKLRQTGSSAWSILQSLLTSTLEVEYDGKIITLSEVRNLAEDKDQDVRKKAFEAEIKAYEKIDKSIAAALNSIKGEVNTISEARGFASPLDQALHMSRMQKETLTAMQEAVKDYYEVFRAYLKRKAKLLGHKNGLPFYDLNAPIGSFNKHFTIEEANDYVFKNFSTFSPNLANLAKRAFTENWIDYTPRKGKRGGAFCSNMHEIKESRIMTNFTGAFGDMLTLSHELGHAYHGDTIFNESILNSSYTMPVAETASTFCETIVNKAAIKDAQTKDEKIFLLESAIQGYTAVVIDIMSRFIFERSVFEGRKETVYDVDELKELMIKAQKETYGDGLDQDNLHPYMWIPKPHYYSGGLSYYNFPYTFGLLFAKGLYAKYLDGKAEFVKNYDLLLAATGKMSVEDVAKLMNIDVTKKAFWASSLEMLKEDIEEFLELTK